MAAEEKEMEVEEESEGEGEEDEVGPVHESIGQADALAESLG